MPRDYKLHLSPFVQCGQTTSTVGYRDVSSGMLVASLELPAELIERTVLANVSVDIALSSAGEIKSAASGAASTFSHASKTVSLDALVDVLLERNNVYMEEITEGELRILLERLERSVRAVERAIAVLKHVAS
jgi:hypothetical protein